MSGAVRYAHGKRNHVMTPAENGPFVRACDYDTLRAQLESAEAEVSNLQHDVKQYMDSALAENARAEAAEAECARWKQIAHQSSAGCSHRCRDCGHPYTPKAKESEDCPMCGSDGRTKEQQA